MSSALAKREGSVALEVFGREYDAIKQGIAPNLTDAELDYLASVSRDMGLSVIRKQIYGTKRRAKDATGQWVDSLVIQVGIDGYRAIAQRSGKYAGQLGPYWCGPDGQWQDVWLAAEVPLAAKVAVLRSDFKEPLWAVATYSAYAAVNKEGFPAGLWGKMPEVMLAKCAEALALRKAFPDEMSGTYTDEEMQQAENPPAAPRPIRANLAPVLDAPAQEEEPSFDDERPVRPQHKSTIPATRNGPNTGKALQALTVSDGDTGEEFAIPSVSRQHGITKLAQVQAYARPHGFRCEHKLGLAEELEQTFNVRISGNVADAYPSALYDIAHYFISRQEGVTR